MNKRRNKKLMSKKIKSNFNHLESINNIPKPTDIISNTSIENLQAEVNALESQLQDFNIKYRGMLAREKRYLETIDGLESGNVNVSVPNTESAKRIKILERDNHTLSKKLQKSETELAKVHSTITYQLGYRLIHGVSSWAEFVKLPGALWALYRRSRSVKRKRKEKALGLPVKTTSQKIKKQFKPKKVKILSHRNYQLIDNLFSKYEPQVHLKIACIMDDFTYESYKYTASLMRLSRENWSEEIENFQPDLLFVESAWRGENGTWHNLVNKNVQELQDIISWCQKNNVGTIFWNKEDPIHFQTFINTACQFDCIFTTDIDCIDDYKKFVGHQNVYFLPFACQPIVNNPLELYDRKDGLSFAGAYYVKYPDRTADLENFTNSLVNFKELDIYDRNFFKDDADYQFPSTYNQFIVGTLPYTEISKAYKGYRYAINLNSIKQSQSMFARRVFELLGSNTVTISNFSRGVRTLFGDLVLTSDSGNQHVNQLTEITSQQYGYEKFRLAGLRKVMLEHTYEKRLNFILDKVGLADKKTKYLENVSVFAFINTEEEYKNIVSTFNHQTYKDKELYIIFNGSFVIEEVHQAITIFDESYLSKVFNMLEINGYVAVFDAKSYYGKNYLLDLMLGTKYSNYQAVTKSGYFEQIDNKIELKNEQDIYTIVSNADPIRSIVPIHLVAEINIGQWIKNQTSLMSKNSIISIDPFNFCQNYSQSNHSCGVVDDLALNTGLDLNDLVNTSSQNFGDDSIDSPDQDKILSAQKIADLFNTDGNKNISLSIQGDKYNISSKLSDDKHDYIYSSELLNIEDLQTNDKIELYFDVGTGLDIQIVILFFDADKQRIGHVLEYPRTNAIIQPVFGTRYVKLGWRIRGAGDTQVNAIHLTHQNLDPNIIYSDSNVLLVTNNYPSYNDLYKNAFVHSRVKEYKKSGIKLDVFRFLPKDQPVSFDEFETIDVVKGSTALLDKMLSQGQYKKVLVHFLDQKMWSVLENYIDKVEVIVWVHGADIQPWWRRKFNYTNHTEEQMKPIIARSNEKEQFWKSVLTQGYPNLHLVFVSQQFAQQSLSDLGVELNSSQYSIIHNYIDNKAFQYEEKHPEMRKKILSIRPFASTTYANDLTVQAILELSKEPWFNELSFTIIGDGILFDEITAPLKEFKNVRLEKRFLNQQEIIQEHKKHGVFLVPTRIDTQGVSRGEAMSSGLVAITNSVAAIPEFCSDEDTMLATEGNYKELAGAIRNLYLEPQTFERISEQAMLRVTNQCSYNETILKEIQIIK